MESADLLIMQQCCKISIPLLAVLNNNIIPQPQQLLTKENKIECPIATLHS